VYYDEKGYYFEHDSSINFSFYLDIYGHYQSYNKYSIVLVQIQVQIGHLQKYDDACFSNELIARFNVCSNLN